MDTITEGTQVEVQIHGKSPHQLRELILTADDEVFEVEFIKRTTKARRKMRCRLGPHKGGKKSLDMERAGILPVLDVDHGNEWRAISLDSIVSLKLPATAPAA